MRNRIAEMRKPLNLSQQKLGELVGLSRVTINKLETGKIAPTLLAANTLAQTFACSIYEIFDLTGDESYTCPAKSRRKKKAN
ncbi:helix-turn-helix transcriptional regulator [Amygdalobacter nucleatus]|uniref:DNA-binding helix-turn-helix protein n=1 Tax=Amygdalobacter nucleatus TaxID=3029274 RepID=A0A133YH42_9FIRM|nr:helix-turn-helix transcriptional regulator [Amygdalobacter nucleatus]KXB42496.1 DNA-binding helix-turn-helix protein [Amygdalobacter nucleatus]MDF0486070.1 helix-turn-helix transcriptional regulator [Amygdalobacter nucleatus]